MNAHHRSTRRLGGTRGTRGTHGTRGTRGLPVARGALALLAALGLGCGGAESPEDAARGAEEAARAAAGDAVPEGTAEIRFADVTTPAGIDFVHVTGFDGSYWFPEIVGPGCAVLDYDGDGYQDIFLVNGGSLTPETFGAQGWTRPPNALYRNRGDGTFENVTARAGLAGDHYGQGCAAADYDADGDVDLYVTNVGPNQLFRNEGDGTFTDVAAELGVDFEGWSTSAAFGDVDADGDLDLFVVNYCHWSQAAQVPCTSSKGEPDYCNPRVYEPAPDVFYRNDGRGGFIDATREVGFNAAYGHGLGVLIADLDGDGHQDVYVANDGDANNLWINEGDGTFADEGLLSGSALNAVGMSEGSMGVTTTDLEQDGDWDLFMTHMTGETNTLYVNGGGGFFQDVTQAKGLGAPSMPYTGFGTLFFDADLDRDADLLVVNGAVIKDENDDRSDWPYDQPDQLYVAEAGGYRAVGPDEAPWLGPSAVGRGAAFGDLDEDGDIDVVVANAEGPPRILRNDTPRGERRWLGVALEGDGANLEGIGAVVTLGDAHGVRRDRIARDGSYASANEPRVLFGLDPSATTVTVGVRWVDGLEEHWRVNELDRDVTLARGSGTRGPAPAPRVGDGAGAGARGTRTGEAGGNAARAAAEGSGIPPLPALEEVDPAVAERVRAAHAALVASPEAAAAWKGYGIALYADVGSYAGAAEALRRAVALDPDDARSVYLLALCERRLGLGDATRTHLARTIVLAPDYVPPRLRLAEMDVEDRRLDDAERRYREALELEADNATALEGLGRVQRLEGDVEGAVATLTRAIEEAPTARGAHYELGLALRETGDTEGARARLEAANELQLSSIDDPWIDEIFAGRGGDAALLTNAHQARLGGDTERARELYAEYVKRRPDDAIGWANLAAVRRDLGEVQEALAAASRAIELDPNRAESHALLGVLLKALGREEEALGSFQEAVRINPDLAQAWLDQGLMFIDMKYWLEAVEALERYTALRPSDPDGHVALGEARVASGLFADAQAALEQAVALDPANVTAHYRLAGLALQRKDGEAAIAHFEAALEVHPEWPEVHFGLGLAHQMLGDTEGAREAFARAVELRPGSDRFRRALDEVGGGGASD